MIRKLRIKFICVNMLIVTCMLALLFGTLTHYMHKNIVQDQMSMLYRIAEDPGRKFRPAMKDGAEGINLPCFTLEVDQNGKLIAYGGESFDLTDEAYLEALFAKASAGEEDSGVLGEYNLRYLRVENPWGKKIVFADMSSEKAVVRHLMRVGGLLCLGSFALFFVIVLLLSKWAVEPVDEAWRQQKQFVADASHELKTPLTVIISNAELLQQPGYDEGQRKQFSDSILVMSRQMRRLVENLLDLARLDSLRDTGGQEELDFSELVEDCLLPFEPLYFERGLLLESEIEPALHVMGNTRALKQCVDILLDNARKYSEPGSVKLCLRRSGHHCVLTVANPSPELSRGECRDVFKRFYRRDEARTDSGSYGLGLPIAEGIVSRHGGKIVCDWSAGEICFTVTLPLTA